MGKNNYFTLHIPSDQTKQLILDTFRLIIRQQSLVCTVRQHYSSFMILKQQCHTIGKGNRVIGNHNIPRMLIEQPFCPLELDTTGVLSAQASRIFSLVPLPSRSGATTTCALRI